MRVQPWTTEQITMMIAIGKTIVKRWKNIRVRDHHGHHDLCPGYKDDVAAFPFAEVLSGIYGRKVPDVWTLLALPMQRQNALFHLGFDLGTTGPAKNGVDGLWGSVSDRALRQFQEQNDLVPNAMWSTFVCWKIFDRLAEKKIKLADMAAEVERPAGGAPA
jgi:hypothetical protein